MEEGVWCVRARECACVHVCEVLKVGGRGFCPRLTTGSLAGPWPATVRLWWPLIRDYLCSWLEAKARSGVWEDESGLCASPSGTLLSLPRPQFPYLWKGHQCPRLQVLVRALPQPGARPVMTSSPELPLLTALVPRLLQAVN